MENPAPPAVPATAEPPRFRYYDLVMAAFVTILILSNLIGAAKPSFITLPDGSEWSFGAGVLFFPVSYIIGDVLTEVYGYARARRVIWTGFAALAFMAFMAWVVVALPPAPGWTGQAAYEQVFGNTWRIVAASMIAFWAGEFANSYVLARMKVWTRGKALWSRTIGSTVVGQGLDSLIFYPLAFYGLAGWPPELLWQVMLSQWAIKTAWEALLTPFTYLVIGWLKRREDIEIYDTDTDFSPFASTRS
ncbi:queuosine precursor transporter [Qipengyuania sp. DY56-A-20]|jgi:queuosine precursor transporter|uniref:Probable queuosine precursor transporter n=1 Tax=Qipengyuania benthica TaxID=3067651 RepID=A0ABT9H9T2_9SPHN|nr:queuosine precursor transporter [Qipengyuania sp. DY56-A-20]MDP4540075.1 queuosine precursor transporter [Qipengyuania sp. DY56-A-20]